MARRLGLIASRSSALFLCDMQEGFRKTVSYYPQIIEVSGRMLAAAKLLSMPVIVTEQFPKGLGPTVSELDISGLPVFPKKRFSMVLPEVEEELQKTPGVKSVILCGIEAAVCVQNTTLDLLAKDYDVHVVADAVSSRSMVDRMFALQRMKDAGAFITTSESMVLTLCGGADHPQFKPLQKIIWEMAPDSGLLTYRMAGDKPV